MSSPCSIDHQIASIATNVHSGRIESLTKIKPCCSSRKRPKRLLIAVGSFERIFANRKVFVGTL